MNWRGHHHTSGKRMKLCQRRAGEAGEQYGMVSHGMERVNRSIERQVTVAL